MLGYADHEICNHLNDWGKYVHPDDTELVMNRAEANLQERHHPMKSRTGFYTKTIASVGFLPKARYPVLETIRVCQVQKRHKDIRYELEAKTTLLGPIFFAKRLFR